MRRSVVMAILAGASALGAIDVRASRAGDEPRPAAATEKADAPIYLFVEGATDLEALRKRLNRPDVVILNGATYAALKAQAGQAARPAEAARAVVEAVAVGGEVFDDLAHLTIELTIALAGDAPAWVPIRLEKLWVASAREGDKELPLQAADGGWQVQLQGRGKHAVRVALSSVVTAVPGSLEGRRASWAIPEAASTRVSLLFGGATTEVVAAGPSGIKEPLAVEGVEAGQKARASAFLTPRRTLDLAWKVAADPGAGGPPLVTAQGEIALEVDRGSLRARSSWDVRSERGTLRKLELRIDPDDELVGLECDGRPVGGGEPGDVGSGTITVLLAEPVAAGGSCKLVVTTRRALSPETTARTTYRGTSLLNVVSQAGVLAIAQPGGDPWVSASAGRGLRPIDPRADLLPKGLRANPSVVLAYQFVEQPFDLGLQVDPSPPWVRVKTRTTVTADANRARVDAWLDYTVARGRVYEVRVALPEGFAPDAVGPPATVAASEILNGPSPRKARTLVARLGPKAGLEGDFSIHLAGWQAIAPGRSVAIGLPRPVDSQSRGGSLAVLAARGVSAELGRDPAGSPPPFAPAGLAPPEDWAWPPEAAVAARPPALWLRHDDAPAALVLDLAARARAVREETSLEARVERRRLDVRQETTLRVQFGAVNRLDVTVPPEVEGAWDVDGLDVSRREPLGPDRDGRPRYRLFLSREIADTARLRFRLRRAIAPALDAVRPTRLVVPRLEIAGVTTAPARVRVSADEGVAVATEGEGWREVDDEPTPPGAADPAASPARWERVGDGPAALVATAHAAAALPKVVASRLWLRTTRDPEGALRTTATYRVESHDGALVVALPPGAEWVRATVDGEPVAEVERIVRPSEAYRLPLPEDAVGPVVVSLDFAQKAADGSPPRWAPPRLQDGGVVQESYWEARLPWNLALAGTPSGWSDENRWSWQSYALMRSPALPAEALRRWVYGPTSPPRRADDPEKEGLHSYLFARVGGPTELAPAVVTRAGLVGFCSGAVLGLGLLLMRSGVSGRFAWAAVPIALLAAAVAASPGVILMLAQSAALGFALLIVAWVTQKVVDRPGRLASRYAESSGLVLGGPGPGAASGLGRAGAIEAGSEGSTVVRARSETTADHVPTGTAGVARSDG